MDKTLKNYEVNLDESFTYTDVQSDGYIKISILEHVISSQVEEYWIRVVTDDQLFSLMEKTKSLGVGILSKALKSIYFDIVKSEINISTNSLALEIIGHAYADKFAVAISTIPGLKSFGHKIHNHTDIIDCGEREQDANRFFWDLTQGFYAYITSHIFG